MTLACLILLGGVVSQEASGQQNANQQKAKAILDKVSRNYQQYDGIKAQFKYIYESKKQDFEEVREGEILMKGKNFRIDLGKHLIICNNKYVWTYLKDANEVQINDYNPEDLDINPQEMFTLYQEGHLYGYKGKKQVDGNTYHVIELTPKDKDESYFKVRLLVIPDKNQIKQTKIFQQDGSTFTYEIQEFSSDVQATESDFTFDKSQYSDVTEIDLR